MSSRRSGFQNLSPILGSFTLPRHGSERQQPLSSPLLTSLQSSAPRQPAGITPSAAPASILPEFCYGLHKQTPDHRSKRSSKPLALGLDHDSDPSLAHGRQLGTSSWGDNIAPQPFRMAKTAAASLKQPCFEERAPPTLKQQPDLHKT